MDNNPTNTTKLEDNISATTDKLIYYNPVTTTGDGIDNKQYIYIHDPVYIEPNIVTIYGTGSYDESANEDALWGQLVERPWGSFQTIYSDIECKVKRIVINRGMAPSYQFHTKRSEHWYIVSGYGIATKDEMDFPVSAGDIVDIPVFCKHRIRNTGGYPLVFIEIQTGEYFGEDDIVRLEDDYGRN